jgi:acyl-CoA thioesterase FadM
LRLLRTGALKTDEGALDVDQSTTTSGLDIDTSPDITEANLVRKLAMKKKNAKQKSNAEKDILRAGTAAVDSGAAKGAVVSLHVDYRTNAHAQALLAIIYDVKKTGGALVCCEHGIITHDGSAKDYWVPMDKYRVVAKNDEKIPLPDELRQVRDMVLTNTFDSTGPPRISYNKLHEIMISATSPLKQKRSVDARGGRCGKHCGCKRNGVSCHSGCKCNGNCCEE